MTLICIQCGRRLLRAAATVAARGSTPEGAVGPSCARKMGLIKTRPGLFTTLKELRQRRPRKVPSSQMVLL